VTEISMNFIKAQAIRDQMKALADELAEGLYSLDSETNKSLADWQEEARDSFTGVKSEWLQQAELMYKDLKAAETILLVAMTAYKTTTSNATKMWTNA
jgi:uncharacterized protein YukE